MENIRGKKIILDNKAAVPEDYHADPAAGIIYEVIRIIKGKALFVSDHLARLESSCMKSSRDFPGKEYLEKSLLLLVKENDLDYGNVKIVLFRKEDKNRTAAFFIPHFYPEVSDYQLGVSTLTYVFERPDPTIKRWNEIFRKEVGLFIKENSIYEALLVNDKGQLTEGSRSNLFFIDQAGVLYTAPEHMILPGITRNYVLRSSNKLGIPVVEKALNTEEINEMKSCFITGTSPKVLPVKSIDQKTFSVNCPVQVQLMQDYEDLIRQQLED